MDGGRLCFLALLRTSEALQRIAPGRDQHVPGDRSVHSESAPLADLLIAFGVPCICAPKGKQVKANN